MFPVEDNSNTSTDKSLMKIFLQRNYLSFTTITVIYELILICIVACSVILYISTESLTKKHLNQTLNEGNISLRYGEAALIVSSSLTATILSSTNHLKADTVSLITSRTIKYFANHVFTQHNYSNSLYEFSMCFRSIVNDSNYAALIYDTTYINLMKNIYDSVLINSITISHEENAHLNYHIRIQMVSNIFAINLVILLIEIVLLVCIMKILNIIENCLKIYLKLLIDGTNTTASSLEKITQIIDSKTRNILDFINYPTSLVDRNGIIIYVNHYWIVNFKMKPEFIIGQNIDKFLEDIPENKVKIYPLPEMHSIYVIETSKEDIENEEKLNELINEVKHIRSSIIPKQFIDKEPGRYNVGLLIICSLIIEPVSFDELSSDDWSSDYETFLSYFYQQCDEFDDINIIQTSGRELTLLVGVSGKYISKYLTLKTLILISDTLRYIHESEWCGGGFSMCSVITCSHKSEFVIHCNKATTIDMFGSAFSKQMNLRKFIEPNSIIVCKNIINQIKGQECGFDFKKIQPGVYNFILNEPDDEEMNLELSKYPKPHMNSSYYY
ncbi:hypothetical protein TRFO_24542 [Tritrichomonas foetus]|uniref:PAS domain-containing protein n=1 Tax=Tritrichomonas foetus TaxID=1144522 RepID=A0A1J4K799_9EUKA|nr:hypothetical protein TRFO_24542 [Tritrichomonas foetus]|eukprot:OHT07353.1 hypothetical protein TRFO_24542 [Tritrichomonas foetus]